MIDPVCPVSPVSPVSLAHLWVDFRVIHVGGLFGIENVKFWPVMANLGKFVVKSVLFSVQA